MARGLPDWYRRQYFDALIPFSKDGDKLRIAIITSDIMVPADIQGTTIMVPADVQNRYKAAITLFSGTVTANGNSADIDVSPFSVLEIELKVTSVSGTNPTLSVYVEGKFEGTGDYKTLASQENITATGAWFFTINPNAFRYIRIRWVVGGTSPSFTFRVDAQGMV
jgi:putative transposon-encoded protein